MIDRSKWHCVKCKESQCKTGKARDKLWVTPHPWPNWKWVLWENAGWYTWPGDYWPNRTGKPCSKVT